jgi:heme-degrading monooxygenase HmoA
MVMEKRQQKWLNWHQDSRDLSVWNQLEEVGITVSYWTDLDSIKNWKQNIEHRKAQKSGREKWYSAYKTRISKVERDSGI